MSLELDHCQECSSPPLPGERRCQVCKDNHTLREAQRRDERRRLGLCVRCGHKAVKDEDGKPMRYCDEHRAQNDARRLAIKQRRERDRRREKRAAARGNGT